MRQTNGCHNPPSGDHTILSGDITPSHPTPFHPLPPTPCGLPLVLHPPGECLRIKLLQLCVEVLKAARPTIAANKSLRDGLTKWTWRYLTVPEECPCRCGCY